MPQASGYNVKFKTLIRAMACFAITLLSLVDVALCVPLSIEQIKSAKKILIMPGTFDPIHLGHIEAAEIARLEAHADLVIMLPVNNPTHKKPLPFALRLQLMDAALRTHPQLAYPLDLEWQAVSQEANPFSAYARRIRAVNSSVQVSLVVGQDVAEGTLEAIINKFRPDETFVSPRTGAGDYQLPQNLARKNVHLLSHGPTGLSSSQVRRFLHKYSELYFRDPMDVKYKDKIIELSKSLTFSMIFLILEQGFYLGTEDDNRVSASTRFKNWLSKDLSQGEELEAPQKAAGESKTSVRYYQCHRLFQN